MKNTKLLVAYALGLAIVTSTPQSVVNAEVRKDLISNKQIIVGVEEDTNLNLSVSNSRYLNYYNMDGHLTISSEMKSKNNSFTGAEIFISESSNDPYDKTLAYYGIGDRREMSNNNGNVYARVFGHTFTETSNPFTEYKYNNTMSCDLELKEGLEGKDIYIHVRFITKDGYVSNFVSSGCLKIDLSSPKISSEAKDDGLEITCTDTGSGIDSMIIISKDGSPLVDKVSYDENDTSLSANIDVTKASKLISKDRLGNVTTYDFSDNKLTGIFVDTLEKDNYLKVDKNRIPDLVSGDNGAGDELPDVNRPVELPDVDETPDVDVPVGTPDNDEEGEVETPDVDTPVENPSEDNPSNDGENIPGEDNSNNNEDTSSDSESNPGKEEDGDENTNVDSDDNADSDDNDLENDLDDDNDLEDDLEDLEDDLDDLEDDSNNNNSDNDIDNPANNPSKDDEDEVESDKDDSKDSNKNDDNKGESNKDNVTKFDQEDDISDLEKPRLPQTGGVNSASIVSLGSIISYIGFLFTRKKK